MSIGTYNRAREKEKLAEKLSDVNTASDEEENKRKRKIRCKKAFSTTSSDYESEDEDANVSAIKLSRKNSPMTYDRSTNIIYSKPPTKKITPSEVRNTESIDKNLSFNIEMSQLQEINEYQNLNNPSPLKDRNPSLEKNLEHITSSQTTGTNLHVSNILSI